MLMIISAQFHIDPGSLGPQVEWGQPVILSGNNPKYDFYRFGFTYEDVNTCEDVEVPMCATLGYNHTNVKLSPFKFNSQKEAAMGTVYSRFTPNYRSIYGVLNPKYELGQLKSLSIETVEKQRQRYTECRIRPFNVQPPKIKFFSDPFF